MDSKSKTAKGFAYVQFKDADTAVAAYKNMDKSIFQGRLLHILPAAPKRENKIDEFAISKLPLKQQRQIKRKAESATSSFNWNALYMNTDAVMSSISARLGVDKSTLLDPTSSDAAVKQALAETHVIQETRAYFAKNGVDLESFKSKKRGDTAILVKNFPFGTSPDELRNLFEEHGKVIRFLMPPNGTTAIVEFAVAPEARAAFKSLAYRKMKDTILFLEPAPKDLFSGSSAPLITIGPNSTAVASKLSTADLLRKDPEAETAVDTSTLFVRNLNFTTTTNLMTEVFSPLDGFLSARVKTKTDPKKPGQILSMGFGFLEFRTKEQAQAALMAMNGHVLEGHKLDIRASQKALDVAEERRKEEKSKALAGRGTKIIIKNLPFEASKKEVRSLFGAFGQLRSVRVPKKFDSSTRGFAFAEFSTPREAANAMEALGSTHLLGRKLVLEFAAAEAEDAEEELERMQKKVGAQANKVAIQKLTGAGRKKFNVSGDDPDAA
jgi:multiple RNA-binding domain-containing protein 1